MSRTRGIKDHLAALDGIIKAAGGSWRIEEVSQNKHFKVRAIEREGAVVTLTIPVTPGDSRRSLENWKSQVRRVIRDALHKTADNRR